MNKRKFLRKILGGSKNIRFGGMITLIKAFGFRLARSSGEAVSGKTVLGIGRAV
jgi:hypothetical protein